MLCLETHYILQSTVIKIAVSLNNLNLVFIVIMHFIKNFKDLAYVIKSIAMITENHNFMKKKGQSKQTLSLLNKKLTKETSIFK